MLKLRFTLENLKLVVCKVTVALEPALFARQQFISLMYALIFNFDW